MSLCNSTLNQHLHIIFDRSLPGEGSSLEMFWAAIKVFCALPQIQVVPLLPSEAGVQGWYSGRLNISGFHGTILVSRKPAKIVDFLNVRRRISGSACRKSTSVNLPHPDWPASSICHCLKTLNQAAEGYYLYVKLIRWRWYGFARRIWQIHKRYKSHIHHTEAVYRPASWSLSDESTCSWSTGHGRENTACRTEFRNSGRWKSRGRDRYRSNYETCPEMSRSFKDWSM
jgi:hypothetical protein